MDRRQRNARSRAGLVALALTIGLVGAPAGVAAQAPGLGLTLTATQGLYYPGETLSLSLAVDNAGLGATADFYAGAILPDGATVVTFAMDGTPSLGSLANLASLRPLATGVSLGAPFSVALAPLVQRPWTGTEPIGLYTLFLAAVRTGALADGRLDASDLLGLQTAGMSFLQPAQTTVATGQAASALIPPAGGTLTATSTSGLTYTLTVPAGALSQGTSITLTPITAMANSPIGGTLLAGVRAQPEGLQFQQAVTLTITVPTGLPTTGLAVFTTRDDGSGFAFQRFVVTGSTVTVQLAHFTELAVADGMASGCHARSPVGLAACREIATIFQQAEGILSAGGDAGTFTAQALTPVLRTWLRDGIIPALTLAANPSPPTTLGLDALFDTALEEYGTVLVFPLGGFVPGGTDVFAAEIAAVEALLTEATRRAIDRANLRCLADKANYRQEVARISDLFALVLGGFVPGLRDEFGLVGSPSPLTCLRIDLTAPFPLTVPATAATPLPIDARLVFSDGAPGPAEPVVVTVRNVVGATIAPLGADGVATVNLAATVTPLAGAVEVGFRVEARAPTLLHLSTRRDIVAEVPSFTLTVSPASVTLTVGQMRQFTAQVNGQAVPVTWSATGGTITRGGLYTTGGTGTFVVTAASTVTPSQSGTATVTVGSVFQGNFTIDSQARVDSLAGVTEITGSVTIGDECIQRGDPCSTNSLITSLAPLASLRRIGGSFATSRASFRTLQTLSLPALTEIGGEMIISNTLRTGILTGSLLTVDLPALNNVGLGLGLGVAIRPAAFFQLSNADSIVTLKLPSLGTVSGDVLIGDNKDLTSITLGAVQTRGNLGIFRNPALANLSATAGGSVRSVGIINNPLLPQSQIQAVLDGITQSGP